jgi:hypothetical protein
MSNDPGTGFWRSKFGLVCAGFLAIAALFMHHGHGSHDHGGHADTTRSDPDQAQGERR